MIKELYKIRNIHAFCLVNTITLVRIPLIFMFIYNLIYYLNTKEQSYGLNSIIISMLIIFSDFIDGKLARRYKVATQIGQLLDIYLDFVYIFAGLVTLCVYDLINFYFIIVIVYKFLEFVLSSRLLKSKVKFKGNKGQNYFYDLLGTLASGFYYVIPLIVVTFNYFDYIYSGELIEAILVFVTTVTVISSFVKLKYIYNMLIIKRNIEI
ncbi:CDP-alcohol phosphatidyltransferase family protein [Clostridium sp. SM-530-WT-3G]|uniref:CDP-alcohol phosphatidyltransferase family protein n=1 Tax=Clostridium sp. SM-530-WT-3G TaxID=2725303 RepID=UPI00145C6E20|nr:CDP-alcohol phosphatidyltransferase family protein [Clostridium sp. SM-530-WT-3G]NME82091.1 hypothetical protein [Clostridium sp. SM-530-WT-3G]